MSEISLAQTLHFHTFTSSESTRSESRTHPTIYILLLTCKAVRRLILSLSLSDPWILVERPCGHENSHPKLNVSASLRCGTAMALQFSLTRVESMEVVTKFPCWCLQRDVHRRLTCLLQRARWRSVRRRRSARRAQRTRSS